MKNIVITLAALALVAAACVPIGLTQPDQLHFRVDVFDDVTGEFVISPKVQNVGERRSSARPNANAVMELRDAHNILRGKAEVASLHAIAPGSLLDLVVWRGRLDPGAYRVFWGAPGLGHTEASLFIVEQDGRLQLGDLLIAFHLDRDMPVLPVYGDAQPLVDLAVEQLSNDLKVPADQIRPVRVAPRDFPDASLGAPQPGEMYAQVITPGYVIELSHQGLPYVFHGSGERVVPAPGADAGGPPAGSITIEAVQVDDRRVTVRGRSTLPDGACLGTELWVDGVLAGWWPAETCVPVQDGTWQQAVPLGVEQAPGALDSAVQYILRAWLPGGPDIIAVFPFDLAGPPAPGSAAPAPIAGDWVTVEADEAAVVFQAPAGWPSPTAWVWVAPGDSGQLLGFQWAQISPPNLPEAVFLPPNALSLASEAVDLGWAAGRWHEIEVYRPVEQGQVGGQIEFYERHVILLFERGGQRIGLDFYARAQTLKGLTGFRPLLDQMVASATLTY